jgi:hypothetical protein
LGGFPTPDGIRKPSPKWTSGLLSLLISVAVGPGLTT